MLSVPEVLLKLEDASGLSLSKSVWVITTRILSKSHLCQPGLEVVWIVVSL